VFETAVGMIAYISVFQPFAAVEPSANVCIAHGTLCNDPSVYPTSCNKPVKQWYGYNCIVLWLQILVCFGRTPGSHLWKPRWETLAYVLV